MIGAHAVILFSSAGRVLSVEAVRVGLPQSRFLLGMWGTPPGARPTESLFGGR